MVQQNVQNQTIIAQIHPYQRSACNIFIYVYTYIFILYAFLVQIINNNQITTLVEYVVNFFLLCCRCRKTN